MMERPTQTMQSTNNQFLGKLGHVLSRLFSSSRSRVIVVGPDARGRLLATELGAVGKEVSLIKTETGATAQTKAPPGVSVLYAAQPDGVALERAGAKDARCLVAATADDALNSRLCRDARDRFGVPVVITRLKLTEGVTSWARLNEAGMVRITWADTVRAALGETAPSASLTHLASVSDLEQVVDLEMLSPAFIGRKIADLPLNDCEVLALTRNGNSAGDFGSIELCMNDVVTLAGTRAALKSIRESLASL
jgi:Trk K+ transport system NAD-binding subunit